MATFAWRSTLDMAVELVRREMTLLVETEGGPWKRLGWLALN